MTDTKILVGIGTIIYAFLVFSYPASHYNDDSLFLANGILNFSVIDFSPHFPGYVSVVFLGKFINFFIEDAKYSLFILSAICAILIPGIIYLYVKELKDEKTAFIAFILTISSVYLLNISLSMLSESIGLFFFFFALHLLEKKKYKPSGVILAIAFFARPSYLVFYIVGLLYLFLFKKESLKEVLISFLITSLLFMGFIFASEGMLYIYEAKRFILGHFTTWGTGQITQKNWFSNIFSFANIPYLFLLLAPLKFEKRLVLLYMLFISYFIWMLGAQNADNLRHLVPLIFFANIFLSFSLQRYAFIVFLIFCFNIYILQSYQSKLSPIDQIIQTIDDKEKTILSNRSIEILRKNLQNRVFDNYYIHSSAYYKQHNSTFTITTDKPEDNNFRLFKGRFLGEHDFYLIEKSSSK